MILQLKIRFKSFFFNCFIQSDNYSEIFEIYLDEMISNVEIHLFNIYVFNILKYYDLYYYLTTFKFTTFNFIAFISKIYLKFISKELVIRILRKMRNIKYKKIRQLKLQ